MNHQQRIKEIYKQIAENPQEFSELEIGESLAKKLGYPSIEIANVPQETLDSFSGVGYHFDIANIMGSETVLNLGCGSGTDSSIAGPKVGKIGKIFGIDMSQEQIKKADKIKKSSKSENIVFQESYIEKLPFQDDFFDVVMSNGAITLSAEKEKVLAEISRVLRYGGRLAVSDIVSAKPVDDSSWFFGKSIPEENYKILIENSGLRVIHVKENTYPFPKTMQKAQKEYGLKSISILAEKLR